MDTGYENELRKKGKRMPTVAEAKEKERQRNLKAGMVPRVPLAEAKRKREEREAIRDEKVAKLRKRQREDELAKLQAQQAAEVAQPPVDAVAAQAAEPPGDAPVSQAEAAQAAEPPGDAPVSQAEAAQAAEPPGDAPVSQAEAACQVLHDKTSLLVTPKASPVVVQSCNDPSSAPQTPKVCASTSPPSSGNNDPRAWLSNFYDSSTPPTPIEACVVQSAAITSPELPSFIGKGVAGKTPRRQPRDGWPLDCVKKIAGDGYCLHRAFITGLGMVSNEVPEGHVDALVKTMRRISIDYLLSEASQQTLNQFWAHDDEARPINLKQAAVDVTKGHLEKCGGAVGNRVSKQQKGLNKILRSHTDIASIQDLKVEKSDDWTMQQIQDLLYLFLQAPAGGSSGKAKVMWLDTTCIQPLAQMYNLHVFVVASDNPLRTIDHFQSKFPHEPKPEDGTYFDMSKRVIFLMHDGSHFDLIIPPEGTTIQFTQDRWNVSLPNQEHTEPTTGVKRPSPDTDTRKDKKRARKKMKKSTPNQGRGNLVKPPAVAQDEPDVSKSSDAVPPPDEPEGRGGCLMMIPKEKTTTFFSSLTTADKFLRGVCREADERGFSKKRLRDAIDRGTEFPLRSGIYWKRQRKDTSSKESHKRHKGLPVFGRIVTMADDGSWSGGEWTYFESVSAAARHYKRIKTSIWHSLKRGAGYLDNGDAGRLEFRYASGGKPQDGLDSVMGIDDEEVKDDLDTGTREDVAGVPSTKNNPGSKTRVEKRKRGRLKGSKTGAEKRNKSVAVYIRSSVQKDDGSWYEGEWTRFASMYAASRHYKHDPSFFAKQLRKGRTCVQHSASERLEIRREVEDKAPDGSHRVKKKAMVIKDIQ